ncbi:hypothetical protein L1049_021365 [Liquidambar formosana]|uniref:Uncharacterized protein n=1 Tax=Liquidambar formosana TaxID=63359 RepID=A0AAP0N513_LIQFO
MNSRDLICASLEGVDLYLTSFEDGFELIRVSYYVEPVFGEGQVFILRSPRCEGPLSRVRGYSYTSRGGGCEVV